MVNFGFARQRGITFLGLIFVAAVLGVTGVVTVQVVPTVVEFYTIQRAAQKAAEGQTPEEVRMIFGKATLLNDIHSITPEQLDIGKDGDRVVVAFAYQREIHLVGPAYLTLKYQGQSK